MKNNTFDADVQKLDESIKRLVPIQETPQSQQVVIERLATNIVNEKVIPEIRGYAHGKQEYLKNAQHYNNMAKHENDLKLETQDKALEEQYNEFRKKPLIDQISPKDTNIIMLSNQEKYNALKGLYGKLMENAKGIGIVDAKMPERSPQENTQGTKKKNRLVAESQEPAITDKDLKDMANAYIDLAKQVVKKELEPVVKEHPAFQPKPKEKEQEAPRKPRDTTPPQIDPPKPKTSIQQLYAEQEREEAPARNSSNAKTTSSPEVQQDQIKSREGAMKRFVAAAKEMFKAIGQMFNDLFKSKDKNKEQENTKWQDSVGGPKSFDPEKIKQEQQANKAKSWAKGNDQ